MSLDHAQLRAFAAVVEAGSLDGAAKRMHLTPSAVSQRLKALEMAVGQVLLIRSKPVEVTQPGEVILRMARQVDLLTQDAMAQLGASTPGTLSNVPIAVNADSLATWFLPALTTFASEMTFDIYRADEEHTSALLRSGHVVAAVTASREVVAGCTSRSVGTMIYRPMATAAFVDRWFPDGMTAEAIAHAPVVLFDRQDDLQDRLIRRITRRRVMPPRSYIPSSSDYSRAVAGGLGWGLISDVQRDLPASGHLVELDRDHVVEVKLYWQQWKSAPTHVRRVADAVLQHARASLAP